METHDSFLEVATANGGSDSSWRDDVWRKPLDSDKAEIRVLCLDPSPSKDDELAGSLIIVSLDAREPFMALSYVWGDQSNPASIILDGHRLPIARNLHAALRQLRLADKTLFIWADAICIDQDDIPERNYQVTLMGRIYSQAQETCLWLGEEPNIVEAFKILLVLTQGIEDQMETSASDDSFGYTKGLSKDFKLTLLECCSIILQVEFWERLWIVQEVVLSTRAEASFLVCGSCDMNCGDFMTLLLTAQWMILNDRSIKSALLKSALLRKEFAHHVSNLSRAQALPSLDTHVKGVGTLFEYARNLKSNNRKDRVYGLLSIVPEIQNLEPNYEMSTSRIYQEATMLLLVNRRSFDILLYVDVRPNAHPDIPVWASAWCPLSVSEECSGGGPELANSLPLFNACSKFEVPQHLESRLLIRAQRLFTVVNADHLGPVWPADADPQDSRDTVTAMLKAVCAFWKVSPSLDQIRFRLAVRALLLDERPFWGLETNAESGRIRRFKDLGKEGDAELDQSVRMIWSTLNSTLPLDDVDTALCNSQHQALAVDQNVYLGNILGQRFQTTRFALSPSDQFSVLPIDAAIGDCVILLPGVGVPFLLRPDETEQGAGYRIVGPAYVQGIMDGEADHPILREPMYLI